MKIHIEEGKHKDPAKKRIIGVIRVNGRVLIHEIHVTNRLEPGYRHFLDQFVPLINNAIEGDYSEFTQNYEGEVPE